MAELKEEQKIEGVPDEVIGDDLQNMAIVKQKALGHVTRNPRLLRVREKWADPRVTAIRCMSCYRLRQYPQGNAVATWACGCGGTRFVPTFPHPDEEQLALKLYSREIEERGLYAKVAQEVIDNHRISYEEPGDMPDKKIILT